MEKMATKKISREKAGTESGVEAVAELRPRKPHKRRPEEVIARIMEAAMNAFTKDGFNGARLRAIAADAGITIQLLIYHVKTKKQLWQMMMEHVLAQHKHFDEVVSELPEDASAAARLRHVITDMVTYTATHPSLHRIMIQEAAQPSPRLMWLSENLVRPDLEHFIELVKQAQQEGAVRSDIDPLLLRYAVVSMGSVPFSVPAEYEYFSGKSPFSSGEVQKTIDMVHKLIFTGD